MSVYSKTGVLILAAGFGSRLMPYTKDRPKCMVKIDGRSILERQKSVFKVFGIDNIAVVTGHASDAVASQDVKVFENADYANTNMVHSLMMAREWIERLEGDLIISYGDIVFNRSVFAALLEANSAAVEVVLDKNWRDYWQSRMDNPLEDAETLKLRENGNIYEIGKKASSYSDIEGQYIGLQKWSLKDIPRLLSFYDTMDREAIYDTKPFPQMYMTSFLQNLIDNDIDVHSVPVSNGWLELDTVDDYKIYESMIKDGSIGKFYDISEGFS